ncbi:MAG: hypothetical protein Q8N23_35250 [Archangium sp.]|nr:hypothetical protein [Archangium sp.]MDP3157982.1 hypothetical protein [Archangium sp.]MDP3574890.1 hypothetical protein [Archangium sp.]
MIRHHQVHAALEALQQTLEAKDAIASESATEKVLALLALTTEPSADERLRPIFAHCQRLAFELKASLQEELRRTATTSRAAQAYEQAP